MPAITIYPFLAQYIHLYSYDAVKPTAVKPLYSGVFVSLDPLEHTVIKCADHIIVSPIVNKLRW